MPNLLSGINLALRALLSQQQTIEVIEHNVANANTPGYRRQEAVLATGAPYPAPGVRRALYPGQMGSGVMVDHIRQSKLLFFDGRLRRELADSRFWDLQSQALEQVERTLSETGEEGLTARLDAFWAGWQALNSNPTDITTRIDLKERGVALAQALNQRARSLITLRDDQDKAIVQSVAEINNLATQVAQLNAQIAHIKAIGEQPNDLLDERDRVLDRLAETSGARASIQDDGQALVSIGGHALVVGSKTFELAATPDPGNNNLSAITWAADGQSLNISKGELAGLLEVRDRTIPDQLAGLNAVAYELATRVNTLHQSGYGINNATNLNFFAPFTSTDYALEIQVGQDILADPANIATASAPDSPGDGSLAATISAVQNELLMSAGSATLNQYYTAKVGELALELKGAITKARDHGLIVQSLNNLKESVSGVSLDEEAANLVKAQKSFQAAARLMTVMDEMLDRIINGMGVVGR